MNDRGSISVVVVGLVGGVISLAVALASISMALVVKQRTQAGADAAALAAADVASGAVAGYPCELAGEAARLNGVRLVECVVSDGRALVIVGSEALGIRLSARAGAGPPGGDLSPPDYPIGHDGQSKTASR